MAKQQNQNCHRQQNQNRQQQQAQQKQRPVSYTHLTLPTILRV